MGTLRSKALRPAGRGEYVSAVKGRTVNRVLLGEPILLSADPITLGWDDSALPNGEIDENGNVTPDE